MPVTFAHPAVVIPVHWALRRWTILSALVIGSILPDLKELLPAGSWFGQKSEAVWFLLWITAGGYLLLWIFHDIVKRPLVWLLTARWQRVLAPYCGPFSFFPLSRFVAITVCLLFGIASHYMLDDFAHSNSLLSRYWPGYQANLFIVGKSGVTGPVLVHIGGSTLGVIFLFWSCLWWMRQRDALLRGAATGASWRSMSGLTGLVLGMVQTLVVVVGGFSIVINLIIRFGYTRVADFIARGMIDVGLAVLIYCTIITLFFPGQMRISGMENLDFEKSKE